jgi:prevent-host-death family protein
MQSVSATDAKQNLAALLDSAQRGPVVIQRRARDSAVLISPQEYDRLRGVLVSELEALCARVAGQAAAHGLTQEKLDSLLLQPDA